MSHAPGPQQKRPKWSSSLPWIKQDGHRIYFQQLYGDQTGASPSLAPVILHHGLAQAGFHWKEARWCDAFGNRDVYAIDALGHGQSDKPKNRAAYSVERRAEAAITLADSAGVERFVFFGFSMGGRVGFELALNHPERVDRLIIGGMHGLKPSIDRRNLERRVAVLRSNKWRLVERAVGAHKYGQHTNKPEALALSTEAVLDWRGADDRLPDLQAPTLVYCGEQDSLLKYAAKTAELIPGCQFEKLPKTGHAASFYSSSEAHKLVQDFLS